MPVSYVSLYRKYRPGSFGEIVGQDHVTRSLINAIEDDRLHHAYLFSGPRGTGKTSIARILAKAVNCVDGPTSTPCGECDQCVAITDGNSVDVIELDMASHGGVDDARELRDRARFSPASARMKVYILDEVHMASTAAFNALLKLIEEPPSHVLFAMATTDPQKVLPTIMSRVQRLDLRRVAAGVVATRVKSLVEKEHGTIEAEALDAVVRAGDGSLRDTESVLEQVLSYAEGGDITVADVVDVLGQTPFEATAGVVAAMTSGDLAAAFTQVQELLDAGTDLRQFTTDLVGHVRDLLVLVVAPGRVDLVDATAERRDALVEQSHGLSRPVLTAAIDELAVALAEMRQGPARLALEVAIAKVAGQVAAQSAGDRSGVSQSGGVAVPEDSERSADFGPGDVPDDPAANEEVGGTIDRVDEARTTDPAAAGKPTNGDGQLDDEPVEHHDKDDKGDEAVEHDDEDSEDQDKGDDGDGGAAGEAAVPDDQRVAASDVDTGDAGRDDVQTMEDGDESMPDGDVPGDLASARDQPQDGESGDSRDESRDGDDESRDQADLPARAAARGEQVARDGIATPTSQRPEGPSVDHEAPPEPDEVAQLATITANWSAILELVRAETARGKAMLDPAKLDRLKHRILTLAYGKAHNFHAETVASGEFDSVLVEAIERTCDVTVRIGVELDGQPVGPSRPKADAPVAQGQSPAQRAAARGRGGDDGDASGADTTPGLEPTATGTIAGDLGAAPRSNAASPKPSDPGDATDGPGSPDAMVPNPMADLDPAEAMDRVAAALAEELGASEVTD